ncbi:MAG: type II secretion system inner membrane protein GspF [Thiohalomonadaceae bacterium]
MGAFEYRALDAAGREKKGVLEGDTARQIRQSLREQGLTPLAVNAVFEREQKRQSKIFAQRISASELALITRQLATLVRSGLPLEETLHTVARQASKPRLRNMLMAVRSKVLEGHTIAAGLDDFPHVFPDLYRATVAAGEHSGHLDRVLERLADYTEARQQLRQKIQLALFYPTILTAMALAVTVALLAYVVPQVVQVFDNIGQQLPALTRGLIALSDFIRNWGLALALLMAATIWLATQLLRRPEYKTRWHALLLRLPLIGQLSRGVNTARFARTLSILSASGVAILDAMHISAQVLDNLPMRTAVEQAAHRVREGSSIHKALAVGDYFPAITLQLIASGEASGQLDNMLERAALNQERELETTIATLMGLFEPLLILVMGGVVLIIVLAILLPIFDLNQLVK